MNRYELFRVRSALVKLIATDKISVEDEGFQNLYELVNISIANTKVFHVFTGLIPFVLGARKEQMPSRISRLIEVAAQGPLELRKITSRYFNALAMILWRNSLLLRIYLRMLAWKARTGARIKKYIPWLYEAGEIEKSCRHGAEVLTEVA